MTNRGRPKGSIKTPPQQLLNIWLLVEARLIKKELATGKRPSVNETCNIICKEGGMNWIIGGDLDLLARITADPTRSKRIVRKRSVHVGSNICLVPDPDGKIFVSHSITDPDSLRTRYVEANKMVQGNEAIKRAWTDMLYDMLGLPHSHLVTAG